MQSHYVSLTKALRTDGSSTETLPQGIAILANKTLKDMRSDYYVTNGYRAGELVDAEHGDESTVQKVLLSGVYNADGADFRIATTHFTRSAFGQPDDKQRRDVKYLLKAMAVFDDILVCGDFNAPRGGEIFDRIAKAYIDWMPKEITTTIDQNIHNTKGLQRMVDNIFSTKHYALKDIRFVDRVSDHCAVVGIAHRV